MVKRYLDRIAVNVDKSWVSFDNQGTMQLSTNSMFHDRTKHIRTKRHFIREIVNSKEVQVDQISTHDNLADILTKALPVSKFDLCVAGMSIGWSQHLIVKIENCEHEMQMWLKIVCFKVQGLISYFW